MPKTPSDAEQARHKVIVFLALAFGLSCIFYCLIAANSPIASPMVLTMCLMWCPAAAAIITRLYCQKNLEGFGFGWGEAKWQLAGIFLPIALGAIMFGSVWLSGAGEFNSANAAAIFSVSFLPSFAIAILFNLFAAFGEELGWRGLLVPEMSKFMGFTQLALLSGAIWAVWHFPLIIFGSYHGVGSLWFSLLTFFPSVVSSGLILAWLRLKSGSVWVAVSFHGIWNYFIQQFYPALTVQTPATEIITGEFGWLAPLMLMALAVVFWHFRGSLPKPGKA